MEGFSTHSGLFRGGLSRGGCDIRGSSPPEVSKADRGRYVAAGPDSSGLVGGKEKSCKDRLWFLTRFGRESSPWLIWTESDDTDRDLTCDLAKRVDGNRIADNRLRRWSFAMVVAGSKERCTTLSSRAHVLDQPGIW